MMPTYMTLHNNSPKVDMTLPINASFLTISGSMFEEKLQPSKFANINQGKIKLPFCENFLLSTISEIERSTSLHTYFLL